MSLSRTVVARPGVVREFGLGIEIGGEVGRRCTDGESARESAGKLIGVPGEELNREALEQVAAGRSRKDG